MNATFSIAGVVMEVECERCKGTAVDPGDQRRCRRCDGRRRLLTPEGRAFLEFVARHTEVKVDGWETPSLQVGGQA